MANYFKIILIGSIVLNLVALWGYFHYIKYGGNPLGELKRKLTGSTRQVSPPIPFSEENAGIMKEIAEGKTDSLRVVFYGASITRRWNLNQYFPEIHPVNRGVGGYVSDLLMKYKSNVLDLKPKAVVIKFCSINIRPQFPIPTLKDGIQMMVELAQDKGIIPILATIIPPGKSEARIGNFSVIDTLKMLNNWIRDYAKSNNIVLIDYAADIQNGEGFLPMDCSVDPVHVSEKGYAIMAKTARPVIYRALNVK